MHRGVVIAHALVRVGSLFEEKPDDLGVVSCRGPRQREREELPVGLIDRGAAERETTHRVEISVGGGTPDRGARFLWHGHFTCRRGDCLLERVAPDDHAPHRRDDRDHADEEGQRDPLPAVPEEAGDAAALEQHRAEEPAHDEEERQPEAVQHLDERPDRGRRFVVHRDPGDRGEGESRVQRDAEQHGGCPERVEVVTPGSSGCTGVWSVVCVHRSISAIPGRASRMRCSSKGRPIELCTIS